MFIKSFKKIMRGGNKYKKSFGDKYKKRNKKRQCYECGEVGHYIADCPKKKNDGKKEWRKDKYKKDDKNKEYKKKRYQGHAHVGEEWDSKDESSSSDDEGVASIAIQIASPGSCLFTNLTDDESDPIPTCLMAKGKKVPIESSPPSDDDKENMMKEFGEKGYKLIKKLMEKLEKREMSLEMQEDLLVLEKERNLALDTSLAKANEKVEKLALELTLANDSIEEKNVDIAKANSSIDSLKEANVILQENLSCLSGKNKDLEVQLASLRKSNFSSTQVNLDSNVSTSKGCKRCYNHDMDIYAANLDKLGKLEREVKLLKTLVKDEMLTKDDGSKKDVTKFKPLWNNKSKKALRYNPNKENPRKIINGKSCLKFNKGVTLYEAMNKIHGSNSVAPSQVKEVKKEILTPISRSFTCDYVLTWDHHGKMVVKYIGAHTKKEIIKKSVWVPKALVTNSQGPKSIWVPKSRA